jgi:cold-inducible RNA-binding protein
VAFSPASFRLQKGLIFETMPLTAEVQVLRLRWLGPPDCPHTTTVSLARSATRVWVPGRRSGQVKKLYIGNLPFSATEDQLHEWFSQIGVTPSGVNLIRDRFTGQSRGFAFVEVNNDEDADRAVNSLNGQNFGGRNLVVNEARPQAERGGGGGGGRGGYGGGGGGGRGGHGGGGGGRGGGGGGGRGGDRGGDRGDRGNRW